MPIQRTKSSFSFRALLGLRRKQKSTKLRDDNEASSVETPASTPASTPQSSLETSFDEPVVMEKTPVPVQIPIAYYYSQTTYVGGKKVPFTRLHAKQNRRRLIIYERIHEDRAFLVNWRGD
ncbi:hypothetical protein SPRG_17578 [Saprolegnia parasitica CBS 223.65]|uniref:Uncharacterized protein n=1 Tax=Saprolegnia parasitica (strain CBS 223.65) TaxID=695850 RepID=A0A067BF11_SAPPC|nr:hypothetical protein SPRG_17578 [Saprolegnia parasitica CBS 223.65]KDO16979.1 hypothetical protein SPRG_17578 [Saprolegnia parasitica CBS 223.65]|eukprot:XP_012212314.1 hypothetical protein SPRG_17578 [Saprolegnia parasitica CBS 223.65]